MQKLLSLYLDNRTPAHRESQELLAQNLASGWKVISVTPVGAGVAPGDARVPNDRHYLAGWVVVVLEKA